MRWTAAVVVTGVVMALACGGGSDDNKATTTEAPPPPPPPPPAPPPEVVKAVPVALTFADVSFACCNDGTTTSILDNYMDFLRNHNNGELTALAGVAKKCHDIEPAEDKRSCDNIDELTQTMRKSDAAKTSKVGELGMRVMEVVKRHKGSGSKTVAIAHCDKNDGYWIQSDAVLKSPFGGDNANCGEFIKAE